MSNPIEMMHRYDKFSSPADDDSKAIMTYKDKSIYNLLQRSRKVRNSKFNNCIYNLTEALSSLKVAV